MKWNSCVKRPPKKPLTTADTETQRGKHVGPTWHRVRLDFFVLYNSPAVKFLLKIPVFLTVVALCLHAEPISQLHPANYVNDFAGVLDSATQEQLNDLCRQVDQKAHAQIAVVTIKSTDGQDIVSYAVALYQAWAIGPKSSNRGVLILLAVQDRKYWTTVGYGLEPILPDGKVGGFGREAVPLLRSGDYGGAVALITSRVASVIAVSSPSVPQ